MDAAGCLELIEPSENLEFLNLVLDRLGLPRMPPGRTLLGAPAGIAERAWHRAWNACRVNAETASDGSFERLELQVMDSHVCGVVRWLAGLGVEMFGSCEGHGRRPPNLAVGRGHDEASRLIREASRGRVVLEGQDLLFAEPRLVFSRPWPQKDHLLDIAENLHCLWKKIPLQDGRGVSGIPPAR